MAEFLYRVGRFCSRHGWIVVTAWLVVLAAAATAFVLGRGPLANGFDIPGTETAKVTADLDAKIPGLAGGNGMVVFRTANGAPFTAAQTSAISALAASAQSLPYVQTIVDPFETEAQRTQQEQQLAAAPGQIDAVEAGLAPDDPLYATLEDDRRQVELGTQLLDLSRTVRLVSTDGSTAVVAVTFTVDRLVLPDSAKIGVRDHFLNAPIAGVSTTVSDEIAATVPGVVSLNDLAGVVVAAIVLLIVLGTVLAAAMPIVTALLGLAIGALLSLSFSGLVQMAAVTPILGIMLGLAVGIDYALFIVNRHRKQLYQGMELHGSIGLATGTSGNAVVFAGSTVLIALVALNMTHIPFLGLMGDVGAVCVAVAVLLAITFIPALLGLVGPRVLTRRARRRLASAATKPRRAPKPMSWARAIISVALGITALVIVAAPSQVMRLGLPDGSAQAQDSTQYQAFKTVAAVFGEGFNGPLLVTATLPTPAATDLALLEREASIGAVLGAQADVIGVAPAAVSDDKTMIAFEVIPREGPTRSSTEDLVRRLRALSPRPDGTVLGVAGQATGNIDISETIYSALPGYVLLVIGVSMVIMIVVFRSLVVPFVATAGFALSLVATFGALVAVYQWGWAARVFGVHDPGPLLNFAPVLLVGILFGLAMDYQLFIAAGMREAYAHGTPARTAVTVGFRAGRSVVIAAAIIMVAVFSGFIFSDTVVIRPVGFGLAFGVLADAFIVRMLIIPAVLHLVGPAAWWLPRWLAKIIPNVDVEGRNVEARHHIEAPTFPAPAGPTAPAASPAADPAIAPPASAADPDLASPEPAADPAPAPGDPDPELQTASPTAP